MCVWVCARACALLYIGHTGTRILTNFLPITFFMIQSVICVSVNDFLVLTTPGVITQKPRDKGPEKRKHKTHNVFSTVKCRYVKGSQPEKEDHWVPETFKKVLDYWTRKLLRIGKCQAGSIKGFHKWKERKIAWKKENKNIFCTNNYGNKTLMSELAAPLQNLRPWATYSTSPCFSFLICKMGIHLTTSL